MKEMDFDRHNHFLSLILGLTTGSFLFCHLLFHLLSSFSIFILDKRKVLQDAYGILVTQADESDQWEREQKSNNKFWIELLENISDFFSPQGSCEMPYFVFLNQQKEETCGETMLCT